MTRGSTQPENLPGEFLLGDINLRTGCTVYSAFRFCELVNSLLLQAQSAVPAVDHLPEGILEVIAPHFQHSRQLIVRPF